MKSVGILILMIFIAVSSIAREDSYIYKNFTTSNGLPSNQVYHIYQDDNGYLWFATDRGIARYNGYTFESFDMSDGLTDNTIFKFYPQHDGSIWCSTFNNKLFYFNTEDYEFHPYKHNDQIDRRKFTSIIGDILWQDEQLSIGYKRIIGVLYIDKHGKKYSSAREALKGESKAYCIAQHGTSLMRYVSSASPMATYGDSVLSYREIVANSSLPGDSEFGELFPGVYFFLHNNSLIIKKENRKLIEINNPLELINAGAFDDSLFYVSSYGGGVEVFNLQGDRRNQFLEGKSVTHFFRDHEGGMWFATLQSGVFYVKSTDLHDLDDFNNQSIQRLARDQRDHLWLSTKGATRNVYEVSPSLEVQQHGNFVTDMYPVSYNERDRDLEWYFPNYLVLSRQHKHLLQVRGGTRYEVSTRKIQADTELDRSRYQVLPIAAVNDVAKKKECYILCDHYGVIVYENGHWDYSNSKWLQQRIEDIEISEDVEVYATLGSGIILIANGDTINIQERDGLSSNMVNRTYFENDSTLWVCTNRGVNKITLGNTAIRIVKGRNSENLDVKDIEFTSNYIWMATLDGLYYYERRDFDEPVSVFPLFLDILSVKVNGAGVDEQGLVIDYTHKIEISFHAISFAQNSNMKYRYKRHAAAEWIYTDDTKITFSKLEPGDYDLTIQASVDDFENTETLTLPFYIKPPFYRTWWFLVCAFAAVGSLIYWFFKKRVLSYNRDVVRELVRLMIRRLKRNEKYLVVKDSGSEVKIPTQDILYVTAAGNYLEIHTSGRTITFRHKIREFFDLIPDPIEYIQIHRSIIIRIDQVQAKSRYSVTINHKELKVTRTYQKELAKIQM